jgi:hypothetical protein
MIKSVPYGNTQTWGFNLLEATSPIILDKSPSFLNLLYYLGPSLNCCIAGPTEPEATDCPEGTVTPVRKSSNPEPVFIIKSLGDFRAVHSKPDELRERAGVYSFINNVNGKQYIGSSSDLKKRFWSHYNYDRSLPFVKAQHSNWPLQYAMIKYGLNNFSFVIYEFYKASDTPNYSVISLETAYMRCFARPMLYNVKVYSTRAPGPKHSPETLLLMSKPGALNPMWGKKHTAKTKALMAARGSKFIVSMYDKDDTFMQSFNNNVELANLMGCHRGTVGKYIKSGQLFRGLYYFKKVPK